MPKPCVVFDIDGTLADNSHRLHFISTKPRNWEAYNANMHLDEPIDANCRLLRAVATQYPILLMTGREQHYTNETVEWLNTNYLPFNRIFMRPTGLRHEDHKLKLQWLAEARLEGYEPFLVVEDRSRVVEMWRRAGLTTLQCAEGNY